MLSIFVGGIHTKHSQLSIALCSCGACQFKQTFYPFMYSFARHCDRNDSAYGMRTDVFAGAFSKGVAVPSLTRLLKA